MSVLRVALISLRVQFGRRPVLCALRAGPESLSSLAGGMWVRRCCKRGAWSGRSPYVTLPAVATSLSCSHSHLPTDPPRPPPESSSSHDSVCHLVFPRHQHQFAHVWHRRSRSALLATVLRSISRPQTCEILTRTRIESCVLRSDYRSI